MLAEQIHIVGRIGEDGEPQVDSMSNQRRVLVEE